MILTICSPISGCCGWWKDYKGAQGKLFGVMGIFTISTVVIVSYVCIHMSKFIKMYTFDTWAHYVIIYQLCLKQFFKTPSLVCGVSNIELVNCSFIIENPILPILISKVSALTHTIFGYGFRCRSAFTVMAERGESLMGEGVATVLLSFSPFLGKFMLVVVNCFLLIVCCCLS